ncbi:MAG TPA: hypothetical protein VF450_14595, partial [Noviherbaspirillum sp.]
MIEADSYRKASLASHLLADKPGPTSTASVDTQVRLASVNTDASFGVDFVLIFGASEPHPAFSPAARCTGSTTDKSLMMVHSLVVPLPHLFQLRPYCIQVRLRQVPRFDAG